MERRARFNNYFFSSMAFGFIWKKQFVWFLTLVLVVGFGLLLGAMLQERFQENAIVDSGEGAKNDKNDVDGKAKTRVGVPSLSNYPTAEPGVGMTPPSGNPPRE